MTRMIDAMRRAQRSAPVDVMGFANDMGVLVSHSYLEEDISGELVRNGLDGYDINVNASHSKTRQRFTIAHELGHFIYHRNLIGEGVDDDRLYRSTNAGRYHNLKIGPKHETEANQFAASFLMPMDLIDELQQDGLDRKEIASRLEVSEHALAIRLGEEYP